MTDGDPSSEDDPSQAPDDVGALDDAQIASLAARIWSRLISRNPDLRDESGD